MSFRHRQQLLKRPRGAADKARTGRQRREKLTSRICLSQPSETRLAIDLRCARKLKKGLRDFAAQPGEELPAPARLG